MAGILVRFSVGLLALCLGMPACIQLLYLTIRAHPGPPQDPWAVAFGLGCGLVLALVMRPTWFVHTWLHENAHLAMCVLFWLRIENFQASSGNGGVVVHQRADPIRTTIIALAPYTLPLLLIPFAVARYFVPASPWRQALTALVVCAAIHHLVSVVHNVRTNFWPNNGDLAVAGRFLSIVVIAEVLVLLASGLVWLLWSG